MDASTSFRLEPLGPFDLQQQNRYFNPWPTLAAEPRAVVMAFPVEGWASAGAVVMRQQDDGSVVGEVVGAAEPGRAWGQACAAMSLDEDGTGWPAVGERDEVIGRLQREHRWLRPNLFHSPYEAACSFLLGHRISIAQVRAIRARLAEQHGERLRVGEETFSAFPTPQRLLQVTEIPGVAGTKVARLHEVARAALEGWLDRDALRAVDPQAALTRLRTLPGVGAFFASGILLRGAGLRDAVSPDEVTCAAVQQAYALPATPSGAEVERVAQAWLPYRMWANVLLHVAARSSGPATRGAAGRRSR